VLEKADDVVFLEVEVVLVDARAELHLLDDDDLLLLLGLALLLLFLEEELAVVHDLADGRVRRRRDLDQVEVFLASHLLRLGDRYDSDLLAVCVDQTDFRGTDQIVDAVLGLDRSTVKSRIAAWRENTLFLLDFRVVKIRIKVAGRQVRAVGSGRRAERGESARTPFRGSFFK
jgi:hypothetical protein